MVLRNRLILFLFWVSIAYASRWFNGIILLVSDSYVLKHLFANHAQPFVTLFFAALIYFLSHDRITLNDIPKLISFKLLIVALIFMVIETIHFPNDYSLFKQFKYLFYSKLISSFLVCVLIIFIIEIVIKNVNKLYFIVHLIYIISFKAIGYMFMAVLLKEEVIPLFINNLIFNSSQAYESLAIIFVILFGYIHALDDWKKYMLIYVNALPMFFFECRGASLTFIIISIFFLIETFHRQLILKRKILLLTLLPLLFFSFLTLKGVAPLGITTFHSFVVNKGFSATMKNQEQIQIGKLYRNLSNLLGTRPKQIERYIGELSSDDSLQMNEQTVSAFSRIGTFMLGISTFIYHPILGIGSHNAYTLHVAGFGIHSLAPLILASYGMVGFLPLAIFCIFVIGKYTKETGDYLGMIFISSLIILFMTFINSFSWMYSFAVLFFYYAKSDNCFRCPISKEIYTSFLTLQRNP
ncbi:MAG: hypothetical protein PHT49_00200 [Desulfovibrionales bacterium]|nr:hypothetical protein [Desulfovibrionales bacterium]